MSTRISSAALLLALTACSQESAEKPADAAAEDDNRIECALGGATEFKRECVVEQVLLIGGVGLTVRHPDGSFRRFTVYPEGIDTADGADRAEVTLRGDTNEVVVDSDRYRFPNLFITVSTDE
jgi:hypothetical protein